MKAYWQHFFFEFRTGIRNRALLFLTYLFPLLVYALLGAIMTAVNPDFKETLIPAMLTIAILSGGLLSIPDQIVNARVAGIYRSYKINGVPAINILSIPALAVLLHMLVIGAVITLTAPIFFKAPLPTNWISFGLVYLAMVTASAGLALLIGVISTSSQMTVLLAQLIFLPSMVVGGIMMPTSILPAALQKIALLLPSTHAMNAFRSLAYGQPAELAPLGSLLILLCGAVLAFGLAWRLFYWDAADPQRGRKAPLALLALLPYVVGMLVL